MYYTVHSLLKSFTTPTLLSESQIPFQSTSGPRLTSSPLQSLNSITNGPITFTSSVFTYAPFFSVLLNASNNSFMSFRACPIRCENRSASVVGQLFFADTWKKTMSSPAMMYDTP